MGETARLAHALLFGFLFYISISFYFSFLFSHASRFTSPFLGRQNFPYGKFFSARDGIREILISRIPSQNPKKIKCDNNDNNDNSNSNNDNNDNNKMKSGETHNRTSISRRLAPSLLIPRRLRRLLSVHLPLCLSVRVSILRPIALLPPRG